MTAKSSSPGGTHEGWMQSSTCRAVEEAGKAAGREYGLAEAMAREWVRLLNRQGKQKFGGADIAGRATLEALGQAFAGDTLLELADRLLAAPSWTDWMAGVIAPSPAAG